MASRSPISHIETPSDRHPAYSITAQNPVGWRRRIRASDIFWLVSITVMLLWPWIFFSQARDGIQMPDSLAILVIAHPHTTSFFVTFISTLINMILAYLFSKAVIRFSQEWITKKDLNLFGLSLISGFSSHKIPWGPKDISYVFSKRSRILRATLIISCWAAFTFGISGFTSLLGPVPFERPFKVQGTELDLSTNDTTCLNYLRSNPNNISSPVCGWTMLGEIFYTTCLVENQIVDVLESGRSNILSSIEDHPQSIVYSQLSGLQFLGSIRGVLPMGPDGPLDFDIIEPSPPSVLSNISYSYTVLQQGLNIDVNCNYDTQSPINTFNVSSDVISYNATCGGQTIALTNETTYEVDEFRNTLAFWACKSPPNATEASYSLYLQGNSLYDLSVGNMTCSVSQAQPAIFTVKYNSTEGSFSAAEPFGGVAPTFPDFIDLAVEGLSSLIEEAQSGTNEVADSILTFGIKYFGLDPNLEQPNDINLRLYEYMIQGVLEYLATYSRLLYTAGPYPSECSRNVTGNGTYTLFGWSTGSENIGQLMPLTIINFTSFVIMILAIIQTTHGSYQSNPTEPMALALAEHHHADERHGWKDRVIFRDRQANPV
ncbi:hypothetical protein BYT27DRAFT_7132302 [Phlegmacium glaucopus]|nr:hypothetical protein BYT27DRAFT_7132302 [Phlegmacium glaucopus]